MNFVAEPVLEAGAKLGEGALWDARNSLLHWVDIEGCMINTFDPETGEGKSMSMPGQVSTIVQDTEGNFIAAIERDVVRVDKAGQITLVAKIEEPLTNRLNDGKCDPAGRFWCGSMHKQFETGAGKLYMLDARNQMQPKLESVTISNGLVWTRDAKTMYYIDTLTGHLDAFDYDIANGALKNRRTAVRNVWTGYFDGMAIDCDDNVYIALWGGGCVLHLNPSTGELLSKIVVPQALNITSCAFGGKEWQDLYITTAAADVAQYPQSGSVFKVRISQTQGLPANQFAG